MKKALLTVFALVEVGAGLLLVLSPSALTNVLFGTTLDTATALITGRVAGIALLSLVIACWLARNDPASDRETGVVAGTLLYNAGVVAALIYASSGEGLTGVGLWPAVAAHAFLGAWCIAYLWRNRTYPAK